MTSIPFRVPLNWGDVALFSEHINDPSSPFLSDLVEMFLKENVKDPSIVTSTPASTEFMSRSVEYDVAEIRVNNLIVCWVLNTVAVVRLRGITPTFVRVESLDIDVPAADPLLFEKLWEHLAKMDAVVAPSGYSILEKLPESRGGGNRWWQGPRTPEDAYPGFSDAE